MVLYQLSVRREARARDDDTWNLWMLREGEVYDQGGVPAPQTEEPSQWAAFRQAVMRKMGQGSEQWQQVLRLHVGPDPVIDPREDEPEEEPVPRFQPAREWLPSLVEPGASLGDRLVQRGRWTRTRSGPASEASRA